MRNFLKLINRFGADERGVFAVIFSVMAVVLVAFSGAVVDYVSVQQAKTRAQVALDAAALALQPKIFSKTEPEIKTLAETLLLERLTGSGITAAVTSASYDRVKGTLTLAAGVQVQTAFVRLVGVETLEASLRSEATRGSRNIEVAIALDTTGSMGGQKIKDLRLATEDLINIIVKDVQTPTYSKLAMAPYAANVNVGAYADAVRGAPPAPKAITNAAWAAAAAVDISGATKANPVVITTAANHSLVTGDWVLIEGVAGMTQLNGQAYKVTRLTNTTFSLGNATGGNIDGRNYSNYTAGNTDTVRKCTYASCEVQITAKAHGFANGDYVRVVGTVGPTRINDNTFKVASRTVDTMVLTGSRGGGNYASGGSLYCTVVGCQYLRFINQKGDELTWPISTCVTERTSYAYKDTAPSTAPLGPNYPSGTAPCVTPQIMPLTDSKASLITAAKALPASGTTAGQIGLAWAWYLLSPEFSYLWPEANRPGPYDAGNLSKFLILMTDGYFNTSYCEGVLSKDSNEFGNNTVRNSCNAPNGGGWDQATKLCDEMRGRVTIFTVGFDIDTDLVTQDRMKKCAGNSDNFYLASNGTQLRAAFREIADRISVLRISE